MAENSLLLLVFMLIVLFDAKLVISKRKAKLQPKKAFLLNCTHAFLKFDKEISTIARL